jgi:hypothetical protein
LESSDKGPPATIELLEAKIKALVNSRPRPQCTSYHADDRFRVEYEVAYDHAYVSALKEAAKVAWTAKVVDKFSTETARSLGYQSGVRVGQSVGLAAGRAAGEKWEQERRAGKRTSLFLFVEELLYKEPMAFPRKTAVVDTELVSTTTSPVVRVVVPDVVVPDTSAAFVVPGDDAKPCPWTSSSPVVWVVKTAQVAAEPLADSCKADTNTCKTQEGCCASSCPGAMMDDDQDTSDLLPSLDSSLQNLDDARLKISADAIASVSTDAPDAPDAPDAQNAGTKCECM